MPAFRTGETTTGALAAAALAIVGVAVLKAAGIVARRLGAGVMQYRLQARYRRAVTRQYLRLPLSWHQRHPTGQLLSNANADVEAIWFPIAPLPMAVGVLVMLLVAGVALVLTDPVLSLVGFLIFPAIFVLNVVYQRRLSPLATRAQQLRAEVSGVAHESFDGALVVKTLGREPEETERFQVAANELRDAQVAVGRVRGMFDPVLEALPTLGVLAVLLVGAARVESGDDRRRASWCRSRTCSPCSPSRCGRSAGCWASCRAASSAGTGCRGCWRRRAGWRTERSTLADVDAPASLDVQRVGFAYDDADVLHDVSFTVDAGRTVALVGPTGSGKSTLTTLLVRLVDPASGEVVLDGVDLRAVARGRSRRGGGGGAAADVPVRRHRARQRDAGARRARTTTVLAALRVAQADRFVDALAGGLDTRIGERGMTLSGGQRQRLALARAVVRSPRLLVMDDATSVGGPAGGGGDPGRPASDRRRRRRPDGGGRRVPQGDDRAGRRGGLRRARPGRRPRHARRAAACAATGYRRLITAYEREDAERGSPRCRRGGLRAGRLSGANGGASAALRPGDSALGVRRCAKGGTTRSQTPERPESGRCSSCTARCVQAQPPHRSPWSLQCLTLRRPAAPSAVEPRAVDTRSTGVSSA